jgi:threonine synthase
MSAPESCIDEWMKKIAHLEGLAICPETAICMGVLDKLLSSGAIKSDERILVFNTGGAMKYPELIEEPAHYHDLSQPFDWSAMAKD